MLREGGEEEDEEEAEEEVEDEEEEAGRGRGGGRGEMIFHLLQNQRTATAASSLWRLTSLASAAAAIDQPGVNWPSRGSPAPFDRPKFALSR